MTSIPAGTYTFVVHDYSRIHNFARYACSAHFRTMNGTFTVTP